MKKERITHTHTHTQYNNQLWTQSIVYKMAEETQPKGTPPSARSLLSIWFIPLF